MKREISFAWRSLVVGAGYAGTVVLINALRRNTSDARSLLWTFVGGTVIGPVLGQLASSMAATWKRHVIVWGSIIFFNIASVTIEGRFFVPGHVEGPLALLQLQQLAVSLVAAFLIIWLFASITEPARTRTSSRPWYSWLWRFVVSATSYIVFYYLFGAISYLLITGPYYRAHQGGLVVPAPAVILQAELIRAPLIVLSVVPFLLTLRGTGRRLGLLTGIVLFTVGGLAPLLMDVGILPLPLLVASAVEIFFQNFCTGLVTARLLGKPQGRGRPQVAAQAGLAEWEG